MLADDAEGGAKEQRYCHCAATTHHHQAGEAFASRVVDESCNPWHEKLQPWYLTAASDTLPTQVSKPRDFLVVVQVGAQDLEDPKVKGLILILLSNGTVGAARFRRPR